MKVTLNKTDDLNAVIEVQLTPEDYKETVSGELRAYRKKANIPGFRPGNAPMGMIKKMVGKSIYLEEINKLANRGLVNYIVENKLNVVGQPLISDSKDPIADFDKEEDFTFFFDIGMAPEFSINLSEKDKMTRYKIEVGVKEIDEEIVNVSKRYGILEPIEKAEQDTDSIKGTLTELDSDGNAFEGGVQDKEATVLLEMIEDKKTKDALIGAVEYAEIKLDIFKLFKDNEGVIASTLQLPKEGIPDLNKTFLFKVQELKRYTPANIDQELFDKLFGPGTIKDEEEFKAKIKENLEDYYKGEAEHMLDHGLGHLILDKHKLKLPDTFLKRWLIESYPDTYNTENSDEKFSAEADTLRRQLVNEKFESEHKIEINEQERGEASRAFTFQQLKNYGFPNPDMQTVEYFEQKNKEDQKYMQQVDDMVMTQKINQLVKSMITIKEKKVKVDAFYDMIKKHNEEHNH
jgi:trigger factor